MPPAREPDETERTGTSDKRANHRGSCEGLGAIAASGDPSQPTFLGGQVVRVSDTESIALTFFETREALDDVSSKIAGPWFAENVRPYLGGPVERSVGEVVARFGT